MAHEISIDREVCIGSGNCVHWAPAVFDIGDDGVSYVLDPAGDDDEKIRIAEQGCPSRAISVRWTT